MRLKEGMAADLGCCKPRPPFLTSYLLWHGQGGSDAKNVQQSLSCHVVNPLHSGLSHWYQFLGRDDISLEKTSKSNKWATLQCATLKKVYHHLFVFESAKFFMASSFAASTCTSWKLWQKFGHPKVPQALGDILLFDW